MKKMLYMLAFASFLFAYSCSDDDDPVTPPNPDPTYVNEFGMYLLNSGKWGDNTARLDYYDYKTDKFIKNIYDEVNQEVKGLGDVGNDLQVYGSKMYIAVNGSNKLEIVDKYTTKKLGKIDITNCRFITPYGGRVYVSSYATESKDAKGALVYEVDTTTLAITRTVTVGFEPEQMVVRDNKLYVANSGGYHSKEGYENTISVVDLKTFKEENRIEVAKNLEIMQSDNHGNIYITSRGDYSPVNKPSLYILKKGQDKVEKLYDDISISQMQVVGDSLFTLFAPWDGSTPDYNIIDTKTQKIITKNFIPADEAAKVEAPYGLGIDKANNRIYIGDRKDGKNDGLLFAFDLKTGKSVWEKPIQVGVFPMRFAFITKKVEVKPADKK